MMAILHKGKNMSIDIGEESMSRIDHNKVRGWKLPADIESSKTTAVLSRTEALEILANSALYAVDIRDKHAAIKQLSAMEGWEAPKKSELTGKDGSPLAVSVDVSAPEIVKALAELMEQL
jgi:hypothetical protein